MKEMEVRGRERFRFYKGLIVSAVCEEPLGKIWFDEVLNGFGIIKMRRFKRTDSNVEASEYGTVTES